MSWGLRAQYGSMPFQVHPRHYIYSKGWFQRKNKKIATDWYLLCAGAKACDQAAQRPQVSQVGPESVGAGGVYRGQPAYKDWCEHALVRHHWRPLIYNPDHSSR